MAQRHTDDVEVVLLAGVPDSIGAPLEPGSPDVLTGASGFAVLRRWEARAERVITGSGPLGRFLRTVRRGLRPRWVRWFVVAVGASIVVIAGGFHSTPIVVPTVPPAPPADVALVSVPAVIRACPPRQNCLSTMNVPLGFTESVLASFPTLTLLSHASRYDAAIPEVDVEQVVARLPDGTEVVLTQDRVVRGSVSATDVTETAVPGGVLVARQRAQWRLTAQLSAVGAAAPRRVWLDAARHWIDTAILPR